MLIISWNVAGLSTTVNRVLDSYGPTKAGNNGVASKKTPSTVLAEYMSRHGADIFCFQEHKIPVTQLSSRSEPLGCSNIEGYESFWSCCVDPSKKGLNGVVTYVKYGMTLSANSKPLGSPDLDEQGRCVMTDHGKFVVFNVYVPAGGGQPLSYKMKFLRALRRAMAQQRESGKQVILVGDLNIAHQPLDRFWSDRVLFVNDIVKEVKMASAQGDNSKVPDWKIELTKAWPAIDAAMKTKQVVPTKTMNSLTNQKYEKYRMTVQVDGRTIHLGSHESNPLYCEYCYNFQEMHYICPDTDELILAEEPNVISIATIAELMGKIAGVEWDEPRLRRIAATAGGISRVSPPRGWLDAVLEVDRMVDVFRHLYPSAEGRYTCWHQFTNKRYSNEGARIDYTLVDSSLVPYIRKGSSESLRCSCRREHDPNSEEAALCASTANGAFKPVSFEGGGIVDTDQKAMDTQFGPPTTGMLYTPPSYSDHIAVSLLLDDICLPQGLTLNSNDNATRKAQPHKAQRTIASFFAASSGASGQEASVSHKTAHTDSSTSQRRDKIHQNKVDSRWKVSNKVFPSKAKRNRKGSILSHFTVKK